MRALRTVLLLAVATFGGLAPAMAGGGTDAARSPEPAASPPPADSPPAAEGAPPAPVGEATPAAPATLGETPLVGPAKVVLRADAPTARLEYTHTGDGPLRVDEVRVFSRDAFALEGGPVLGAVRLSPGDSFVASVVWSPVAGTYASGALVLRTQAGNVVVPITGEPAGEAPSPLPPAARAWWGRGSPSTPAEGPGLPKEAIDRVVKAGMREVQICFQRALVRDRTLGGEVAVRFVIGPDGAVAAANVKRTTFPRADVEQCLLERFGRLQFPAPGDGGVVIVTYPFVFAPG